jgi:hypothetical protein
MSMLRRCSAIVARVAAGIALASCNAIFGIEEGVPAPEQDGSGGDGSDADEDRAGAAGAGGDDMLASAVAGSTGQGGGGAATVGSGGASGSAGMSGSPTMADADTADDPMLPPGFALVEEPVVFDGRTFSHSLGISGRLSTTFSPVGVQIEPNCMSDTACFAENQGDSFCVQGNVSQVVNTDFANAWGVDLQLILAGDSWDRAGGRVKGLSFKLSGPTLPPLRFQVTRPPEDTVTFQNYCQEVLQPVDGQRVDASFDLLKQGCWDPAATQALLPEQPLAILSWQIDGIAEAAKPFDFCVSEMRPIVLRD